MTPAERLQAAIDKLEAAQGETWHDSPTIESPWGPRAVIAASNPGGGHHVTAGTVSADDAETIVTLHRTMDAQIAILRTTLLRAEAAISGGAIVRHVWSRDQAALALADAILGHPA